MSSDTSVTSSNQLDSSKNLLPLSHATGEESQQENSSSTVSCSSTKRKRASNTGGLDRFFQVNRKSDLKEPLAATDGTDCSGAIKEETRQGDSSFASLSGKTGQGASASQTKGLRRFFQYRIATQVDEFSNINGQPDDTTNSNNLDCSAEIKEETKRICALLDSDVMEDASAQTKQTEAAGGSCRDNLSTLTNTSCDDQETLEEAIMVDTDDPCTKNSDRTGGEYQTAGSDHSVANVTLDDIMLCTKCGNRVLVWEMPEHMDFHFAQDLQKSLRRTDKIEMSSSAVGSKQVDKISSGTYGKTPAKKVKIGSGSIKKFFVSKS